MDALEHVEAQIERCGARHQHRSRNVRDALEIVAREIDDALLVACRYDAGEQVRIVLEYHRHDGLPGVLGSHAQIGAALDQNACRLAFVAGESVQ